jgi:hypothetical protein
LRQFNYDKARTNPRDEGLKDNQTWDVEQVLSHKGSFKNKSSLQFKVKWEGFSDKFSSTLPWSELRDNIKLHEYMRSINQEKFIPEHFRVDTNTNA